MTINIHSHTLFSAYRALLLSGVCMPGMNEAETKERLEHYARDRQLFSPEEIEKNISELAYLDKLAAREPLHCYIDGSYQLLEAGGSPLPPEKVRAGGGFLIRSGRDMVKESSFGLPTAYGEKRTSNHIAEYEAFLACLDYLKKLPEPGYLDIVIWTDSKDLVKQVNGESRIRDGVRRSFRHKAVSAMKLFRSVEVRHCLREKNQEADRLAKAGLESTKIVTTWEK